MFSFWHMVNVITQVVVKKGLEARPVGLRVSLSLGLCPEEQPALPAAVADCFPTLPSVSAAQTTPSGADPPERGNAETDECGEEGRKREKRMGKLQIYILGFVNGWLENIVHRGWDVCRHLYVWEDGLCWDEEGLGQRGRGGHLVAQQQTTELIVSPLQLLQTLAELSMFFSVWGFPEHTHINKKYYWKTHTYFSPLIVL